MTRSSGEAPGTISGEDQTQGEARDDVDMTGDGDEKRSKKSQEQRCR